MVQGMYEQLNNERGRMLCGYDVRTEIDL